MVIPAASVAAAVPLPDLPAEWGRSGVSIPAALIQCYEGLVSLARSRPHLIEISRGNDINLVQFEKMELKLIRGRIAKWPRYVGGTCFRGPLHVAHLLKRRGFMR